MMKRGLILIICLVFLVSFASAATIYVSTTGTDSASCGSSSSPCRHVEYTVEQRAVSGDLVSINDGAYSEGKISVPEGVSITSTSQDNTRVTIQPNIDMGVGTPFLRMVSGTPGSNGNQYISYITIDGRSATNTAMQGIEVRNRNHVSIHHCNIRDFYGLSYNWYVNWGLKVWSSQVTPTSDPVFYRSLFNADMSKSANYPDTPVEDFHFYNNNMTKCGDGSTTGNRTLSQAIWPWHLYNSSFHDNYIDVSHRPAQAITGCSSLLEKVDFYNNIIIGNDVGGYPTSMTSKSLYLIELWVLHDVKFYNNKLINGCFSTVYGKNVEWYNNYVDRSAASNPYCIGIEATTTNEVNIHHNKIVGNPDAGGGMGMTIGSPSPLVNNTEFTIYVWNNIFHGNKAHTIQLKSEGQYRVGTVNAYIYNNIIDLTGNTGGYSGIDVYQKDSSIMDDVLIKNNIITNNRGTDIRSAGVINNLQIINNIHFNNAIELIPTSGNIKVNPSFTDYGNDVFTIPSSVAPQADSGETLNSMFDMGLSPDTYWGTATSEELPQVVLADQDSQGSAWEIGPYVYVTPCTPSWSCSDTNCGSCVNNQMSCTEVCTDLNGCLADTSTPVTRSCSSQNGTISQSGWTLLYVNSFEDDPAHFHPGEDAFDGNTTTYWHTQWIPDIPQPPHEIQINLGNEYVISGFIYLPSSIATNGIIKDYEFYVSSDGINWGSPVVSGTFNSSTSEKEVLFDSVNTKYIRLVALNEFNSPGVANIAELNLIEGSQGGICGSADGDIDGVVSITELITYIGQWKSGIVSITELINAIGEWKSGC